MKNTACFIIGLICLVYLTGCSNIESIPVHDPVYPANGVNVTYTLEASSSDGIENIKLYEAVSSINSAGTVTAGTETLLNEWNPSGSPNSITVNWTKSGGYLSNKLVAYRFYVQNGRNKTKNYTVTYAIRPYPVPNQPAPVYVQGDPDDLFDVVFIPDTDITNMNTFRGHCRSMILDSFFEDPHVVFWHHMFNFYINPHTGTATDYDRRSIDGYHVVPSNWANLSFCEGKALLHQNNLRDYAYGSLFSSEQQNRGTMMHESGHSLFNLADEYNSGVHWQEPVYPNNWNTLAGAQTDAPNRHKTVADVVQMGTTGWYKICVSGCQMRVSGLNQSDYDEPCGDRVVYMIMDNAIN